MALYRPSLQLFQVMKCKGKLYANGGYGILLSEEQQQQQQQQQDVDKLKTTTKTDTVVDKDSLTPTTTTTKRMVTREHLLLEEALFLHEQGMLQIYKEQHSNPHSPQQQSPPPQSLLLLESHHLYNMLHPQRVSLMVYLVYAHLRTQTYRVVRHTQTRRRILTEMDTIQRQVQQDVTQEEEEEEEEGEEEDHNNNAMKKDKKQSLRQNVRYQQLRRELRQDSAKAPYPSTCFSSFQNSNRHGRCLLPAFDVYNPSANFARSHPGLPDFHVAITSYTHAMLTLHDVNDLVHYGKGIPLKIATVSDSGIVIMFGLSDSGIVPSMEPSS